MFINPVQSGLFRKTANLPNDAMVEIQNNIIFEEACESIKHKRSVKLLFKDKSMEPFLKDGKDFIIISKIPEYYKIKKGDVLLFQYEGFYMVHRVYKIESENIIMKGDHQNLIETINKKDVAAYISCVEYSSGLRIKSRSLLWKIKSLKSFLNKKNHTIKRDCIK